MTDQSAAHHADPEPRGNPAAAALLATLGLRPHDLAGVLAAATALVEHVARADVHGLRSDVITRLPVEIERHSRVVEAARARALSAMEADGTWALGAERTARAWYAGRAGLSPAQAGRHLHRARVLRDHLPGFGRALAEGRVSPAAVDTLAAALTDSPARQAALSAPNLGEAFLVRAAADLPANDFRTVTQQWAARVDPDAAERAWRSAIEREEVTLSRTMGGWHLQGWLSHETGLTLKTALDAVLGRAEAGETRSPAQRNAAAVHTLARRLLDSGEAMPSARVRPHLTVHVPLATAEGVAAALVAGEPELGRVDAGMAAFARDFLEEQAANPVEAVVPGRLDTAALSGMAPATYDDGTPVAPGRLAQALCDGELTRYVFSGAGEPLNVGPARRLFSARQVKAITARDRHCQFHGCTAPPTWCEAHHAIPWEKVRKTDVPNGILLCWTHHRTVHQYQLTITRHVDRWVFHHPDGRVHSVVPRGAAHPAHQLQMWPAP